jgi:hypothetical protein
MDGNIFANGGSCGAVDVSDYHSGNRKWLRELIERLDADCRRHGAENLPRSRMENGTLVDLLNDPDIRKGFTG